jgi:hypothetical protein
VTSKTIQPIETHYKGYRFRSRLEARWAVFFDALEIEWDYEPEGFDLGEYGWYLPDFYLKTLGCFCEIKPTIYKVDNKPEEFHNLTNKPICVCIGIPGEQPGKLYCMDVTDSSGGMSDAWECEIVRLTRCIYNPELKMISPTDVENTILINDTRSNRDFVDEDWQTIHNIVNLPACFQYVDIANANFDIIYGFLRDSFSGGLLNLAYNTAKSARFEHGENGITRVMA